MKQNSAGFTLIELMVVLSVTAILGTLGIVGFNNYNQAQTLQISTNEVVTMLNLAKSRAQSQIKIGTNCANQGNSLDSYSVTIVQNSYGLAIHCSNGLNNLSDIIYSKTVPNDISFDLSLTSPTTYSFPVLTGGVVAGGQIALKNKNNNYKCISINSLGGVSIQSSCALAPTPTTTSTPTPTATNTPTPTLTVIPTPWLPNGNICSNNWECISGNCYVDVDGDRYAPNLGTKRCRVLSQLSGNDCYDSNINVHPGQTEYFTTNRGDGSFDYNCDNVATKFSQMDCLNTCSFDTCFSGKPNCTPGFIISVPACGQSEQGTWSVLCFFNAGSNCTSGGYTTYYKWCTGEEQPSGLSCASSKLQSVNILSYTMRCN